MFMKPAIQLSGRLRTNARELRKNLTDSERRLWRELRFHQTGHKFRRQFAIGKYIVDFACPKKKLIIELDGGHHQTQIDYDASRTQWLENQGYTVLRFWNSDIQSNLNGVRQTIYMQLKSTPHLGPPPQGGRKSKVRILQ